MFLELLLLFLTLFAMSRIRIFTISITSITFSTFTFNATVASKIFAMAATVPAYLARQYVHVQVETEPGSEFQV